MALKAADDKLGISTCDGDPSDALSSASNGAAFFKMRRKMETKQTLLVLLGDQQIHGSKRWFAPTLENHMLVFRHELLQYGGRKLFLCDGGVTCRTLSRAISIEWRTKSNMGSMEKEWKKEKLFRVAPDFVLLLSPHDCTAVAVLRHIDYGSSRSTPISRLASTQCLQRQALLVTTAAGDDALNP
ncbi:hypothetical protein ACHAWU_007060 [Discostella pseudostelligera]|uniref:Uncharacterized protein n=1 Tax=Discostella pseudostelligera TaxID=259834 RepID=A0ABD3MEE2_9STRA